MAVIVAGAMTVAIVVAVKGGPENAANEMAMGNEPAEVYVFVPEISKEEPSGWTLPGVVCPSPQLMTGERSALDTNAVGGGVNWATRPLKG
jgi:hypothetical protein